MEIGTVRRVDIDAEMQAAYLDYAMSVIVARALPDVRDGFKPVHRRILFAMYDMGLRPGSPYKKSARIVGEVLGKYHPHGDMAVYEAMTRMAQDFSLRYTLVDGQGNFGSVDGDAAAAMRYTEARLTPIAMEMLADLDKDTVDFGPNFDGTLKEPLVLPANLPNFLVNGAAGIAVGMATNVPPHNLSEVCDAITYMIDHWSRLDEVSVEQLMQFIQGPDFPTGGIVYRYAEPATPDEEPADVLLNAYAMGRGRFIVQAKAHIEEMSRSRHRIVVTELPYQVNKSRLIERIAELAREGRLEGIADLRDESDRQGMRVVIELTRTVDPRQVLKDLYRLTPMQETFGMIMLALVNGEPRLLSLKKALQHYIEHRQDVIVRRSRYELAQAKARAHILEGLRIALDHLDEVIDLIRHSSSADTARTNLQRRFKLTEIQAQAILDMPLRRLAALERRKIEEEYKEKQKLIQYLEGLLRSPRKVLALIREDVQKLKAQFGDVRRTQIVAAGQVELTARELVPDQAVLIGVSRSGQIWRTTAEPARFSLKEALLCLLKARARHDLLLFVPNGQVAMLPVHQIPDLDNAADLHNLAGLPVGSEVISVLALPRPDPEQGDEGSVVLATRNGRIKRVSVMELFEAAARGLATAILVEEGDALGWAVHSPGGRELLLVTANGQGIRFPEDEVRVMGLNAAGVWAIKLQQGDHLVSLLVIEPDHELLTITAQGYAKRSAISEYPVQGRYGSGVVAMRISERTGPVVAAIQVEGDKAARKPLYVVTTKKAMKKLDLKDVPVMSRATQGRAVVPLTRGDEVSALVALASAPSAETQEPETPSEAKIKEEKVPEKAPRQRTKAAARSTKVKKPAQNTKDRSPTTGRRSKKEEN